MGEPITIEDIYAVTYPASLVRDENGIVAAAIELQQLGTQ